MAELSTVITAAGGLKVYFEDYNNQNSYPTATAPGPLPCLVIVQDPTVPGDYQYAYFYYQTGGSVAILNTGWSKTGGS